MMILLIEENDNLRSQKVSLLLANIVKTLLVLVLELLFILEQLGWQACHINNNRQHDDEWIQENDHNQLQNQLASLIRPLIHGDVKLVPDAFSIEQWDDWDNEGKADHNVHEDHDTILNLQSKLIKPFRLENDDEWDEWQHDEVDWEEG